MKTYSKIAFAAVMALAIASCATTKGAAVGAGIGAIAGDAGKGAAIGASAGAVVDIID
ncbi:hypothetical protein [Croceicoccus marinus]|uniref:YMGG-like Gly-zipper domain-containing protein n=1 Tax=Croceicoccus marinus TaxID=450378 RepID=A0A7G6VRB7_9SPHN|nr:hypothetical protein [Croceicoccus marinus]QNE04282.1 hypothetical protein H4O24_09795 [Croceicoccus marinus]